MNDMDGRTDRVSRRYWILSIYYIGSILFGMPSVKQWPVHGTKGINLVFQSKILCCFLLRNAPGNHFYGSPRPGRRSRRTPPPCSPSSPCPPRPPPTPPRARWPSGSGRWGRRRWSPCRGRRAGSSSAWSWSSDAAWGDSAASWGPSCCSALTGGEPRLEVTKPPQSHKQSLPAGQGTQCQIWASAEPFSKGLFRFSRWSRPMLTRQDSGSNCGGGHPYPRSSRPVGLLLPHSPSAGGLVYTPHHRHFFNHCTRFPPPVPAAGESPDRSGWLVVPTRRSTCTCSWSLLLYSPPECRRRGDVSTCSTIALVARPHGMHSPSPIHSRQCHN